MLIDINHQGFIRKKLQVHLKGLFLQPVLLCDGIPVKKEKKSYVLADDHGNELISKFKIVFGDVIPVLVVGENEIRLLPKLKLHESIFVFLPLGLIAVGGALGGGIGAASYYLNSYIIRKYYNHQVFKYLFPFLITIMSVVLFLVIRDVVLILLALS